LKAWTVIDPSEESSIVIFADTRGKARMFGAGELGSCYEFIDYGIKRSPEFDKYAEQGEVPLSVLMEHNWWIECRGCDYRVFLDDLTEGLAVMIDGEPYCAKCAAKKKGE